jgi:hypothetical protein
MRVVLALLVIVAGGCGAIAIDNSAQAAETTVFAFFCDGKITDARAIDAKPRTRQ